MKRETGWLAAVLACLGTSGLVLAAACGDDNPDSSFSSGGTSGTSGASGGASGGFGGTSGGEGGTGASGGPGSSGGATTFDPDAACATSKIGAQRAPANILFIVDRSGSMNCNPPPTTDSAFCETHPVTAVPADPTKWTITRDALKAAIAGLPNINSAGVTYFNTDDDCAVHIQPDVPVGAITADQITLVNNSLDAVVPKGLTPIVGGVTDGYNYLYTTPALQGKKDVLVLLTDGQETCAPDQQDAFINTTVKNASSVGISTYVIGAPGSEPNRAFLSQVAFNGGTASSATCTHAASPADQGDCHFDLSNAGANLATDLAATLATITQTTLGCEFDVPTSTASIDYSKVNVIYTPSAAGAAQQTIAQDTTKGCDQGANGWQYSPDGKRITLCGAPCTTLKADPGGSISIALGCSTETTPK